MLARMTSKMTENYNPNSEGSKKSSGIKTIISPILDRIIISNKSVINDVATGGSCDEYYPTECNPPGTHTYQACVKDGKVGLITCSKSVSSKRYSVVTSVNFHTCLFKPTIFTLITGWILSSFL